MTNADDHELQLAGEDMAMPDMGQLARHYEEVVSDLSTHVERQQENHRVRHMEWDGQAEDGRKHSLAGSNKQPFPWDGASDLRVPVVDSFVNFGVALDCQALQRANIRAVPVESGDVAKAAVVSNFMRWLVMSQMEELPRERELLANYRRQNGIGFLGVFWEKRSQKTQIKVSLEEVAQMMPDVAQAIQQGLFEEEVAAVVVQQAGVSKKRARRMIKELRETGVTTVPVTNQVVNRPVVKAYALGEDLFLPPNTAGDVQAASAIFRRAWMTPEALRSKVVDDGWDADYVDEGITKALGDTGTTHAISDEALVNDDRTGVDGQSLTKGMVEVVYAYRRLSDEDGIPGIFCTVFFPACHQGDDAKNGYAKHELLGDRHGQYPFVAFKLENTSRLLIDSRGEAEVGRCWQDAIKVEMDARIDHASMSTVPPLVHPAGRQPGRVGPGSMISERRPGEFRWMEVPPPPAASREVQQALELMARDYFGLPTTPERQAEAIAKQQHRVSTWLLGWQQVFRLVWSLYKQYGPDEQYFRVIGATEASAVRFAKAEMDDTVDFYLAFDVLTMDPEGVRERVKAITEVAATDTMGIVDKAKTLAVQFDMIDPMLAEQLIIPQQMAAAKEISETHVDIAKMTSGVDLDVPPNVNAQLRLQTLQQWQQGTPDNPAQDVQQAVSQNPNLQKRLERYQKQLEFMLTQQQNAVTGRIGTTPAGATSV